MGGELYQFTQETVDRDVADFEAQGSSLRACVVAQLGQTCMKVPLREQHHVNLRDLTRRDR